VSFLEGADAAPRHLKGAKEKPRQFPAGVFRHQQTLMTAAVN